MYINREIYTYPDPRSRWPEARWPDARCPAAPQAAKRTIVRVTIPGSGKIPGTKNAQGCLPGSQRPGTITRTILRVTPMRLGDPDSKYDMRLGSPLPTRHNPNNFSGSRPRSWVFPCWMAKKTGLAGVSPPSPSIPATLLPADYSLL